MTGFNRTFRQNTRSVKQRATQGCIFCTLLYNLLSEISPTKEFPELSDCCQTRHEPGADFGFSIHLESPWKWSTISISRRGGESPILRHCYRLYPVDSRFPLAHLTGSTLPSNKELAKDTEDLDYDIPAIETHKPVAQYESHSAQTLERNGNIFQTLIKDCLVNHSACTPRSKSLLPSMLLQISGTITSPSVRLAKVADITVRPLEYVCLSYCWGGPQPGMTTASRVASYIEKMDITTFPATVLDAIRVTLSLSIDCLWVDAYCIVQDSAYEKIAELNKMASIYAGAVCTLCAMSARAATEGFLGSSGRTDSGGITTWHASIHNAGSDQAAVMEARSDFSKHSTWDEPLLTRAWTFQEALLSPRLIMFFSDGQLPTLRCSKSMTRSDGGIILQYPQSLMCIENTMAKLSSILGRKMIYPTSGWEPSYEVSEEWSRIVMSALAPCTL
jgi:hypothetical protein